MKLIHTSGQAFVVFKKLILFLEFEIGDTCIHLAWPGLVMKKENLKYVIQVFASL